jgi:DNA-binding response OmpR family regulator
MTTESTHVLLIEDNPGDADLIRLRLVEAHPDVSVSCVNRLSTGLASMIVSPPAMVLLDLNLPDSHGADTYRTVLKETPVCPSLCSPAWMTKNWPSAQSIRECRTIS